MDNSHWSLGGQIAVTLAAAFTGALSTLGSAAIVYIIIWRRHHKKYINVRFRLLLSLCFADILNSLCFVFFPFPVPQGTPGVWGAMGNYHTCNFQGVMQHLGAAVAFYNAALSHYFMKSICDGLSDHEFAVKYETMWHVLAIGFPLGTSMIVLALDSYAYTSFGCWIGPYPFGCHADDIVDCMRGAHAFLFGWIFMGVPLLLLVGYIGYCMLRIYKTVKEMAASRDEPSHNSGLSFAATSSNSYDEMDIAKKEAAIQAYLYVGGYIITHQWAFVVYIIDQAGAKQPIWTPVLNFLAWPLQGFLNAFIFLSARVRALRRKFPEMSRREAWYNSFVHFEELLPERQSHNRRRHNAALVKQFREQTRLRVITMPSGNMAPSDHIDNFTVAQIRAAAAAAATTPVVSKTQTNSFDERTETADSDPVEIAPALSEATGVNLVNDSASHDHQSFAPQENQRQTKNEE